MNRRQFIVSGALTAGYALAARPVFANAITTSADGLTTGTAEVAVADGTLPAYFALPEAASAGVPLALVVHEIFGVHEYIRDVVRRLAKAGYFAIAPDLYQRQGDVSTIGNIRQIISEVVMNVPDAQVMADLDATRAWAAADGRADVSRCVITGFCWGGRIVWLCSGHAPDIAAGAAWYGRLVGDARPETPRHPVDIANGKHAPVLGLYGAEDTGISLASVDEMRKRIAATGNASEIMLFAGAPHGFHADYRASYRALAASEGWRRMLAWFAKHGAAGVPVG